MKKNSVIAVLLSVFTVLFLSNFKLLNTLYLMPNIFWVFPLFCFYFLSVWYFLTAFKTNLKTIQKVLRIIVGSLGFVLLLYVGFFVWKINQGNIFLDRQDAFQLNFKNIFFWIVYQSYLLLFLFSSFKQLVTIDQK